MAVGAFPRFWAAATTSSFGSAVSGVALPALDQPDRAVLGASLGGVSLTLLGDRGTLLGIVAVFAVATAIVAVSPLRRQGRRWDPEAPSEA